MSPHNDTPTGWAGRVKALESKIAGLERELRMVRWGIPISFAVLALTYWLLLKR